MFDWNDLKHVLAVARHGSTLTAGKALGLSQSTVHRRLTELETRLGREVVKRHSSGYRLTEFGQELLVYAERVEAVVREVEQHVTGSARDRAGIIRLTCPEPIVYRLKPLIDRFHAMHTEFQVEFVTSDRYLNLLEGDADVAFRSGDTDDDLVGRKIADSIWAVYASSAYIERHGKPDCIEDLNNHLMVSFDETLSNHRISRWVKSVVPGVKIVARNSSVLGLVYAVRSGIGLGPLPTAIADDQNDLIRVLGPIPELARSWRILTTADLRNTPRVSAFFEFVAAEKDALKTVLAG